MKIIKILKKNFKLLLRSKMTALVVVIAPLLIILLAGIAFNNNEGEADFSIGIYQTKETELARSFITQLENSSFSIEYFEDNGSCKNAVKQAITQACIIFPENFSISDNTQTELHVFADYSRQNFVFYLMETISTSLDIKKSELSVDLTSKILNALNDAKAKNEQANLNLVQLKADLAAVDTDASKLKTELTALNAEKENVAITGATSSLNSLKSEIKSLQDKGLVAINDGIDAGEKALEIHPDVTNWNNDNETYDLIVGLSNQNDSKIREQYNETIVMVNDLILSLEGASEGVAKMEQKLAAVKSFQSTGSTSLDNIKSKLTSAQSSAEKIKTDLETVNQNIDNINIKSADTIVNPIKTTIQPVVTETTNINYMFSYLVMLIVMFVSILLSSTFIIMEKKSKAYFRNFSTPTSDFTFIMGTYITNIIIILLQLCVLFILGYFMLQIPVINNLHYSALLLFIAITLFTAIGMGIGYWFSSQEAAIMLSMSVASTFLLVSNLILPLEVMPLTIQTIASFNPYVMLSEVLRQMIIFNIVPDLTFFALGLLSSAAVVIFLLIIFIQKISKFAYFKKQPHSKRQKNQKKKEITHHKAFKLYERTIENEIDLLNELKSMDDSTFSTYVNKDKNDFYNWAKYMLKDKKLANKLKVKTRQDMINAIEKQ